MTTVNDLTHSTTTSSTSTVNGTGKGLSSLDMNDFITLMVTQLKNQDPTNPLDTSEYVSQLAEFSTVSGISDMNTSLTSLLSEMRNSQALNATSLVGRDVLVEADTAQMESGDTLSGAVDTPSGASSINFTITDSSGQTIRQFSVAATSDQTQFTWDGTDNSGKQVDDGTYKVQATASVSGTTESLSTLLSTKVDSVTMGTSDSSLTLNTEYLGSLSLSDVKQVS